jgi:hypothetical protein
MTAVTGMKVVTTPSYTGVDDYPDNTSKRLRLGRLHPSELYFLSEVQVPLKYLGYLWGFSCGSVGGGFIYAAIYNNVEHGRRLDEAGEGGCDIFAIITMEIYICIAK